MKLTPLGIKGVWLAESPVWNDERGSFREWFKREDVLSMTGINFSTQQANVSISKRGVIRGIHYSRAPEGQTKWVTCVAGAIMDVVVDIRPTSETFGKHISIELIAEEGKSVLIDSGLGHGFVAMDDNSVVAYILSSEFNPIYEMGLNPLDPELGIDWQVERLGGLEVVLSEKDLSAPNFRDRIEPKKKNEKSNES